ncbi:hypothetical protein CCACVL1_21628, partial [Corchorus capsularis]
MALRWSCVTSNTEVNPEMEAMVE